MKRMRSVIDPVVGMNFDPSHHMWMGGDPILALREYGKERQHGCALTPARYDLAVAALGGHGELVERATELPAAIERALASRKPACINVMIESIAAPVIRLG